jgi:hypothetical protein
LDLTKFNIDIYDYTDPNSENDCVLSGTFESRMKLKDFLNCLPVDEGISVTLINTYGEMKYIRIKIYEENEINFVDIVQSNASAIPEIPNNFTTLTNFDYNISIANENWKSNKDKELFYRHVDYTFSKNLVSITSSLTFFYFDEISYDYSSFINLTSGFSQNNIKELKLFITSLGYKYIYIEEFDFRKFSMFLSKKFGANASELRLTDIIESEKGEQELLYKLMASPFL